MSAFTEYAARSERATALNRHTPVEVLADVVDLLGRTTPVSGDMLAVMTRGNRPQQYRRRLRTRGIDVQEARA